LLYFSGQYLALQQVGPTYIESPPTTITTASCLVYYTYGQGRQPFRVAVHHDHDDSVEIISKDCSTAMSSHTSAWLRQKVDLPKGKYAVVFELSELALSSNTTVIGIDDVTVVNTPCDVVGRSDFIRFSNMKIYRNESLNTMALHFCTYIYSCERGFASKQCKKFIYIYFSYSISMLFFVHIYIYGRKKV